MVEVLEPALFVADQPTGSFPLPPVHGFDPDRFPNLLEFLTIFQEFPSFGIP